MSNIQIPFDVLAFWYNAAKKSIIRYDATVKHYPPNPKMEEERKISYEMAKRTVAILENFIETVEITESEEANNE